MRKEGRFMRAFDGSTANQLSNFLFLPDPLSQFQHEQIFGIRKNPMDHSIRALMLAVLEDGIFCYQNCLLKPSRTNERLSREAEEWIRADDDGVFSFSNICETLGLDQEKLRKDLWRWRTQRLDAGQKNATPPSTQQRRGPVTRKKAA